MSNIVSETALINLKVFSRSFDVLINTVYIEIVV